MTDDIEMAEIHRDLERISCERASQRWLAITLIVIAAIVCSTFAFVFRDGCVERRELISAGPHAPVENCPTGGAMRFTELVGANDPDVRVQAK